MNENSFLNECLHIEAIRALSCHQRGLVNTPKPPEILPVTPLIYDTIEKECDVINGDEEYEDKFNDRRYVALGSVFSQDDETMTLLTPYFISIEINPHHFSKATSLINRIKSDVNNLLAPVRSQLSEGTMRIMNKTDVDNIYKRVLEVGYGLQELQKFMSWTGEFSATEILIQQTLGIINGNNELDFIIGGFSPQFYFNYMPNDYMEEYAAQSSYSQMSVDDFLANARGDNQNRIVTVDVSDDQKDSYDEKDYPGVDFVSFDKMKERYPNLGILEFFVPVVIDLKKEA